MVTFSVSIAGERQDSDTKPQQEIAQVGPRAHGEPYFTVADNSGYDYDKEQRANYVRAQLRQYERIARNRLGKYPLRRARLLLRYHFVLAQYDHADHAELE